MLNACGLSELVIKEGDQLAKHEVFAICRPGSIGSLAVDRKYADEQVALYRKMDRPDLIYSVKSLLIRLAKRLHLIS
jgi:hypothetical protein